MRQYVTPVFRSSAWLPDRRRTQVNTGESITSNGVLPMLNVGITSSNNPSISNLEEYWLCDVACGAVYVRGSVRRKVKRR